MKLGQSLCNFINMAFLWQESSSKNRSTLPVTFLLPEMVSSINLSETGTGNYADTGGIQHS